MKKTLAMLVSLGLFCVAPMVSAQELKNPTVRLEPGFSVPLTQPQENRFGPGASATAKLEFNLLPWLGVGPSVSVVELAPNDQTTPGSSVGGAWAFGASARIKKPHNRNEDSMWGVASPWIDGDWQYVRTGDLNRMGASAAVGIEVPVDQNRHLWLGPFLRIQDINDGTSLGGTRGFDTRDAWIGTFGLSIELDPAGYHPPAPVKVPENNPPVYTPPVEIPAPTPETKTVIIEESNTADQKVHFAFDSAVISADDQKFLDEVAKTVIEHLHSNPSAKHVSLNGYASNENRPASEKHNQALSEKRAQAVSDYLTARNVPASVLSVQGFGTADPVADNKTADGRKENRRVEFVVTVSFVTQE